MSSRKPSVNFTIGDFRAKVDELTVRPRNNNGEWEGKDFIRTGALTTWLASPIPSMGQLSHLDHLLDIVVIDRERPLQINEAEILRGDKPCPLMFCILVELNHGHLVDKFHTNGIRDGALPMSLKKLQSYIHGADSTLHGTDLETLAKGFYEKQWAYFPLAFTKDTRSLPLDPHRRLPICSKSKINGKSGTAEMHMIVVPEDFVADDLRQVVPHSAIEDEEYGRCYQFALKSFSGESRAMSVVERDAYHHLRNQKHVIKCFGGFHFKDDETKSHSILLEFGECDLAEYFGLVSPPSLPEDIESFWTELFYIVKAVEEIHSYKAQRGGRLLSYDGWHGDLKPDNILMVANKLKLADPGFVSFVRCDNDQGKPQTPRVLSGWTSTYGPPEVNEKNPAVKKPSAVDMWSIGCVLSEGATWIILGEDGRSAYAEARRAAIRSLKSSRATLSSDGDDLGYGDFFHDGRTVLPVVLEWHSLLRTMVHPTDYLTREILNIIDRKILIERPGDRMSANNLCSEFAKIRDVVKNNRLQEATVNEFSDLKRFIRQARKQPLETWTSSSRDLGHSIEERKNLGSTKSAIFSYIARKPPNARPSRVNSLDVTLRTSMIGTSNQDSGANNHGLQWQESFMSNVSNVSNVSDNNTKKSIFDIYYERKAMESKKFDWISNRSKKTKDDMLSAYCRNRDLVFLVDNAGSMAQVWTEVRFTLTELVGKARNHDEDGLDLFFTRSQVQVKGATRDKALKEFVAAIEKEEVQPQPGVETNMAEILGEMLLKWRQEFERNPRKTRNMTIIILTDGRWYRGSEADEYEVDYTIVDHSLNASNLPGFGSKKRPLSIQFVSFGHDAQALARLQRLDDNLSSDRIKDIVDTEPSSGDIYKMLLGSFIPQYDEMNTPKAPANNTAPQSPPSSGSSNFTVNSGLFSSNSTTWSRNAYKSSRETNTDHTSPSLSSNEYFSGLPLNSDQLPPTTRRYVPRFTQISEGETESSSSAQRASKMDSSRTPRLGFMR